MTLREKQEKFSLMAAQLILTAYSMGYTITLGDAYRAPSVPYGHPKSLHKSRLAIDLNLFRNGQYLTETADHEPLGLVWEAMGGTWGGRFNDGNHYSLSYLGRK